MAEGQPRITTAGSRAAAVYTLMIGALVLLYLWIRSYGDTLAAPVANGLNVFASAASRANEGDLLHVLLALVVVIATARAMGWVFRSANQPPVVGEILAGIVLGPSLLGRCVPARKRISSRRWSGLISISSRRSASSFICSWSASSSTRRCCASAAIRRSRSRTRASSCRSSSARRSRFILPQTLDAATYRSPASRYSSASRCR